jgi:tRNA 2-selenouridine synthase
MPLVTITATDAIQRLGSFDTIIDARSEGEYAEDRVPGAVNWPSLTDEERRVVGTEYAQVSPFEAKKRGAALVARNVARHIEREVLDKPKDWQPLIYCWRGGKRSGSLALVLDQIGFRVHLLEGGYREYRRAVMADLIELPRRFRYRVLCGKTGSGKSRLLAALTAEGAQVLDLEGLANHRGSVLGLVPGSPQPGQKQFESRVWHALRGFDPAREVWVESESKKVGELRVPETLIECMRASPCVRIELPLDERVKLLMEDYDFFVKNVAAFCERLDALRTLRGHELVNQGFEAAPLLEPADGAHATWAALARRWLAEEAATSAA